MGELFNGVDGPIDVISKVGRMGILNLSQGAIPLSFDFLNAFMVSGCEEAWHCGQDDGTDDDDQVVKHVKKI